MPNKLPDISYSWHLKRRYMHITIKTLQVKYGPEAISTFRNHKHVRIETSTTRRWFNHSLSKQLIFLLLNNGMMSGSHLDIKLLEVIEQWRIGLKLMMVTPNHNKHKSVNVMLLHWSKNLKIIPNWKTANEDDEEAEDHDAWWVLTPTDPFPPSVCRTGGDIATSRLLTTWMSLIPTLQVRPLSLRWTTRPWHRSLHHEMEPSLWPGLATTLKRKRPRQTHRRLLLSPCYRPVNMAIQAGLTRRNHIPETVKKRELWSPRPYDAAWKQN